MGTQTLPANRTSPAAIAEVLDSMPIHNGGGAMQRVGNQYATAVSVQIPRVLATVEKRFLDEARCAGDSFFYGWGTGKDKIEGGSIDLAMALIRAWGNCAIEMQPVQETQDAWVFTAAFVDLETGFTLSRQFRQSKYWQVHGKFDEARKEDIRFQIGQSKSIRNVVLNALPKWLTRKGIDTAKQNVREMVEKFVASKGAVEARKKAVDLLNAYGVSEQMILVKFGRPTVAALTVEDLIIMHGDKTALHNGADTVESLYPEVSNAGEIADALNGDAKPTEPTEQPEPGDAYEGPAPAKPEPEPVAAGSKPRRRVE